MKLLGALGIDWKLFLIQCLNFVVLFLILKWLFYRPIIRILRREKRELDVAKKEKEEIERERREFLRERERELQKAKEKARVLIEESEMMARKIRTEMEKEREEKERELDIRFKKEEKESRERFMEDWKKEFRDRKEEEIKKIIGEKFPEGFLKESQDYFFKKMLESIRVMKFDFLPERTKEEKEIEEYLSPRGTKLIDLSFAKRKRIINLLKKIKINVVLESAFPLGNKEKEILKKELREKMKGEIDFSFKEKINRNLLSGFRLRVDGFLVDSNLISEIHRIVYDS